MDLTIQALVMGLVQGLTEFLPISSSGHLILVPYLLKWNDPALDSLEFSVMLHMGTLLALLIYFAREWLTLIPAGLASIRDRRIGDDPDRKVAWLILITAVPAALVGVALNDFFDTNARAVGLVAAMLVVGGAILWLADRWGVKTRRMESMSYLTALLIGCSQAIALLPGISRSGITISAGLLSGLTREAAARFSFLMSMPVIAGAGAYEGWKVFHHSAAEPNPSLQLVVVGFVAAFVSGLIAIKFLLEFVKRRPLTVFVVYRVLFAIVVFIALVGLPGSK